MKPTHPQRQAENATAPSAGGSPDGKGKRLPFRTGTRRREASRREGRLVLWDQTEKRKWMTSPSATV
ncbi:MAG: hypothetical protein ACOX52_06430 [Verrucomicrobiota bacterium]